MKLILASASPRRAELLTAAGIDFTVRVSEIDETPLPNEGAEDLVRRLSFEKAAAVAAQFPEAPVLAADTVVVLDGNILGKPADQTQAVEMLTALSDRAHEVMSGFSLLRSGREPEIHCVCTRLFFRRLSPQEIRRYVEGGEPMDKAGAYGIQSGAVGFVDRIEGSYTNVVGLPLAQVLGLL